VKKWIIIIIPIHPLMGGIVWIFFGVLVVNFVMNAQKLTNLITVSGVLIAKTQATVIFAKTA
jgi:hypothetical protein